MRIRRLHLQAFGPFTGKILDFGMSGRGVVVVHGPNEAGKSSALRAICALRFGIPAQSKDNFLHAHPQMRVGGEFTDRQGTSYSLVRRKGRGATLLLADFQSGVPTSELPAPPEVEALLTCGLTQDAYDSMFGLDHQRLRDGGAALLKGEGDVGAALFEASAGVRSIPEVLERLDETARRFFMPGARGKNARINEALSRYDTNHAALRETQVRPAHWAELFKKHEAATAALADLEHSLSELNRRVQLITELRAVAPLLAAFDGSVRDLDELAPVVLLSVSAPSERAAAESGLSDAQHHARDAAEKVAQQMQKATELTLDTAILAVAPAVRRLAAAAEAIDQHRRDIAGAKVEADAQNQLLIQLAAQISRCATLEQVLEAAPTQATRTGMEALLRAVELAQQALDIHLDSGRQSVDGPGDVTPPLASDESRTALRIAQAQIARSDGSLRRLAALPGEIRSARRSVAVALEDLGLVDEAGLRRVRPLLNAQIDVALQEESENSTRRDGFVTRIDEIGKALPEAVLKRDRLLANGRVVTRDEVEAARSHRDAGWSLVRGTYMEGTHPSIESFAADRPLDQAYEQAVVHADRLGDELARDLERATQLQAGNHIIRTLEADRDEVSRQLEVLDRNVVLGRAAWEKSLEAAGLPALSPAGLRDWQARIPAARQAIEGLQAQLDELEQARGIEQALAAQLRTAIVATRVATPAGDALLGTLSATAIEVEEIIRGREASIQKAAGEAVQRERQIRLRAAHEEKLAHTLQGARSAARPVLAELMLAEDSAIGVARARIGEFGQLLQAKDRLSEARTLQQRAEQSLAVLLESARSLTAVLGDSQPVDPRLYGEQLSQRLEAAEVAQSARALAQRSVENARTSQRDHEAVASRHRAVIASLCEAAKVQSANLLPGAENDSRRKREAQDRFDRSRSQLALASRRSIDSLRELLAGQDAIRMDAEEVACSHELSELQGKLRAARELEELTRRELETIDGSDVAALAREGMEGAASSVRASMGPWIRSSIAHALLAEALQRFRERTQGPMLQSASRYFERMTRGEFTRLASDDSTSEPVLVAERCSGARIRVEEMSEGTLDQLYLALRLAALDIRRAAGVELPVILDDVLMTSDEDRTGAMLGALADFAVHSQVVVFTHHRHVAEVALRNVPTERLVLVPL